MQGLTGSNLKNKTKQNPVVSERGELHFTSTGLQRHVFNFKLKTTQKPPGEADDRKLCYTSPTFELTLACGFLNIAELNPKIK